jgi:F-type H+-transporting ATPase subunit b
MSYEFIWENSELFTQILAFVIFFWILKRYAWGPVTKVLDERQRRIEQGFEEIRAKQADADQLHEDYGAKLRDIEAEARGRVQEAVAEGRRVAAEITENARDEAVKITERAQRNIQIEIEKARLELKQEMIAMTIQTSERLLREKLDDETNHKLVASFIDDLEQREQSERS